MTTIPARLWRRRPRPAAYVCASNAARKLAVVHNIRFVKLVGHLFHLADNGHEQPTIESMSGLTTRVLMGWPNAVSNLRTSARVDTVCALGTCQARPYASSLSAQADQRTGKVGHIGIGVRQVGVTEQVRRLARCRRRQKSDRQRWQYRSRVGQRSPRLARSSPVPCPPCGRRAAWWR